MIINHNMGAINAHRQMTANTTTTQKSTEKLSSGLRINRAGDDAAGLAISEKMRGQIRGIDQASRNAQDGISLIQTGEGALNETHSILQRMREVSVQSANGTNTDDDRTALQEELDQLTSEINRIGNTTEFNTQKILNGGAASSEGNKLTDATKAKLESATGAGFAATDLSTGAVASIKVDGTTFDLSEALTKDWTAQVPAATAQDIIKELENVTAGGVKLSDLVDIKVGESSEITFTAKSSGSTSSIELTADADTTALLGYAANELTTGAGYIGKVNGENATIEKHGLEATSALTTNLTVSKNDTFTAKVGTESEVTVAFNVDKTYDFANADVNVAQAAREDFIKDVNNALQQAGLSDKVTAGLSNDNKLQFISESGKDIEVSGLKANTGFVGTETVKNVNQVVGAGAQGSGFDAKFQIGANTGQSLSIAIGDMRASALGITGNAGQAGFSSSNSVTNGSNDIKTEASLNISSQEDASKAISVIDAATQKVSAQRSALGAVQNRLEHTINNLGTSSENLTSAESRVRDVDMAKEMMNLTKMNVLTQASQAMLAQANQKPNQVLSLLQ